MDLLEDLRVDEELFVRDLYCFIGSIRDTAAILYVHYKRPDILEIEAYLKAPRRVFRQNDVYYSAEVEVAVDLEYTLLYPAESELVNGLTRKCSFYIETPSEYVKNRDKMKKSFLYSVIHVDEKETKSDVNVCFEDEDAIMIENKDEFGLDSCASWIVVFKNEEWRTVRDLRDADVVLSVKEKTEEYCRLLGHAADKIVMFFDVGSGTYPLCFYVFNLADPEVRLSYIGWPLLVDEFIKNLNISTDFYQGNIHYLKK